jgi:hypothetical protein
MMEMTEMLDSTGRSLLVGRLVATHSFSTKMVERLENFTSMLLHHLKFHDAVDSAFQRLSPVSLNLYSL